MSKVIITHHSPDVDAIASIWLVKRYYPGFENSAVEFVQQGETYQNLPVDSSPDHIHVDCGDGKFDHHDSSNKTCAMQLLFENAKKMGWIPKRRVESIERICELVCALDHFEDVDFPTPMADFWPAFLSWIIDGYKRASRDHSAAVELGIKCFDGIQMSMQNKIVAEDELEIKGQRFESIYGKGIAVTSDNDYTVRLAQMIGYQLVVCVSPKSGHVRIKLHPKNSNNLEQLLSIIKKHDSVDNWVYHQSGKMLLNPYSKSGKAPRSSLKLHEIVALVKNMKSS